MGNSSENSPQPSPHRSLPGGKSVGRERRRAVPCGRRRLGVSGRHTPRGRGEAFMDRLEFGVFLAPRADGIGRLRDNVQVAEATGFDFVSIQDHPYVPDFLDTFALIGTLIGETSRLRFLTDVANLPLRPAQMLAKTSASLDLLSGGRFELGIGAGRAWAQIAGLGGPRRDPAEAVAAVSEAIDVLRALWLPGRSVSQPGQYYPLAAQTGPPPAHRIGIRLGAP